MTAQALLPLIVFGPLAGALIAGLFGSRIGALASQAVTTGLLLLSAVLSWVVFAQWTWGGLEPFTLTIAPFIHVGEFISNWSIRLDGLSAVMLVVVTSVSALVHVYSWGYMAEDPSRPRFFAYLSLFTFAMLALVTAADFMQLFFGWEGVGLASYLLIGFWHHKDSANAAAIKAFVVNRVGDFGFALGIMTVFWMFGSIQFAEVFSHIDEIAGSKWRFIGYDWSAIDLAAGLLFIGAMGKSAQFFLHTWLPDAMEGPTPVSALIHAATMVTAGVYLITRSNAIFDGAELAATVVIIVGVITVFMGAIIGSAKDDIKKSLAGSTMSQIGYMVAAVGLGPIGYVFGIFHLLTHGVFKAGLFLGAGSVMHGMNDNVNMRRYGGLRAVMFITFITFAAGWLSILGIPPFSGFWSKDELIHAAFEQSVLVGALLIIAAGITGFYMTRMFIMTFLGKPRWEEGVHPHESPKVMTIPLIILALGSTFLGMALLFWGDIESWLEPVVGFETKEAPLSTAATIAISLTVVILGALVAYFMYSRRPIPIEEPHGSWLTRAAREELYGNQVNQALVVTPTMVAAKAVTVIDTKGVDGLVNGTAAFVGALSGRLRRYQTGFVRTYALSMVGGAVLVVLALVLVRAS